jgi:hypothetical protein
VDAAAAGTDRAGLGAARPMARPADRRPPPSGLIPLTCNEVQELFAVQVARPVGDHGQRLRWSVWRRRHQARARPATTDHKPLATVKIAIYGWSTNPSSSWWRRACGPGPANGGGIP